MNQAILDAVKMLEAVYGSPYNKMQEAIVAGWLAELPDHLVADVVRLAPVCFSWSYGKPPAPVDLSKALDLAREKEKAARFEEMREEEARRLALPPVERNPEVFDPEAFARHRAEADAIKDDLAEKIRGLLRGLGRIEARIDE
jgi:hypothetical protein